MKKTWFLLLALALFAPSAVSQTEPKLPAGFMEFSDGRIEYNAGRYDQALALMTKALAAAPDSTMYLRELARVRIAKGQLAQALKDLDKVIMTDPFDYEAFVLRAGVHLEAENIENVMKDLNSAIGILEGGMLDEELAEYLLYRYALNAAEGMDEEAEADLKRARKLITVSANEMVQTGRRHNRNRLYGLAILAYSAAIAFAPKDPEAYISRAITFSRTKLYDGALNDLDEAAALAPKNGLVFAVRANVLRLQTRHDAAVEAAAKALTLIPADKPDERRLAHEVRALSFCALGNKAEAAKAEAELTKLGGKLATPCR